MAPGSSAIRLFALAGPSSRSPWQTRRGAVPRLVTTHHRSRSRGSAMRPPAPSRSGDRRSSGAERLPPELLSGRRRARRARDGRRRIRWACPRTGREPRDAVGDRASRDRAPRRYARWRLDRAHARTTPALAQWKPTSEPARAGLGCGSPPVTTSSSAPVDAAPGLPGGRPQAERSRPAAATIVAAFVLTATRNALTRDLVDGIRRRTAPTAMVKPNDAMRRLDRRAAVALRSTASRMRSQARRPARPDEAAPVRDAALGAAEVDVRR